MALSILYEGPELAGSMPSVSPRATLERCAYPVDPSRNFKCFKVVLAVKTVDIMVGDHQQSDRTLAWIEIILLALSRR